ncbi:helix-turn-helix domain-containing protein [Aminobacterium colombiense]
MQNHELVSLFENLATVRQSEARICRKIAEEFKRKSKPLSEEPDAPYTVVPEGEWLTPKEFCERYGVDRSTLYRHAKKGLVEVIGQARSKRYRQIIREGGI